MALAHVRKPKGLVLHEAQLKNTTELVQLKTMIKMRLKSAIQKCD